MPAWAFAAAAQEGREQVLEQHQQARDVPVGRARRVCTRDRPGERPFPPGGPIHGVDQSTLEARASGVGRRGLRSVPGSNSAVGLHRPGYLYDERQIIRAGLDGTLPGASGSGPADGLADVGYTKPRPFADSRIPADNRSWLLHPQLAGQLIAWACPAPTDGIQIPGPTSLFTTAPLMRGLFSKWTRAGGSSVRWLEPSVGCFRERAACCRRRGTCPDRALLQPGGVSDRGLKVFRGANTWRLASRSP